MPYISDGEIRSALKRVERTRKQEALVDGEGHGTGRLVLTVRPMPTRVTADWMAQQWRDKKRLKRKIGSYPAVSLASAREIFGRDFAGAIQKRRSIKIATDIRSGTVADLFDGYVASLKAAGKPSWKEAEKGLNKIANTLGRNRPAREIEPEEIVEIIRPIYERGARSMADHVRSYIRSAFSWGMKSARNHVYFGEAAKLAERSSLQGLIASPVPLFVAAAELDPLNMIEQLHRLDGELTKAERGHFALLAKDHGHMSLTYAVNTADVSVTKPLLRFLSALPGWTRPSR